MSLISIMGKFINNRISNDNIAKNVIDYLRKFGYIDSDDSKISIGDIAKAILTFHKMAGLSENDVIGEKTLKAMTAPRCAHKDVLNLEEGVKLQKWGINKFNYYLDGFDNEMTMEEWSESIRIALTYGEQVCNVKFTKVSNINDANFVISLGSGARDQFDGPSGVLAWCELPPSSSYTGQLKSKFDVAETWVPYNNTTKRGIYLVNVACHEIIGHGLGLSHTQVPNSLLNPFYSPAIDRPQADDIQQLVLRYGKPASTPNDPPQPPVIPPTTPNNVIISVTGRIDKIEIPGYRIQKIG